MAYELGYTGRSVAVVDGAEVTFAPWIETLECDHPIRRFVAAMCLYLREVEEGRFPSPANAEAALYYARLLLMPLEDWLPRSVWPDVRLAEHFNVPLAEIAERRRDVSLAMSLG